ncbi:extracellular solute-binding protein [Chloroflexi bacterium TSY]|nr:extracellular solute-binding protein [Chloroflexi bacterium TSY]
MNHEKISRRQFLTVASASVGAVWLAACTPAAPGGSTASEGSVSAETVEITHFDRNIPQDVDFRNDLAERFHEENPNITVKIEVMPEDYATTLITRLASGTAGDCYRSATHWGIVDLVLRNVFHPLDDFVEQDGYDLSVYFDGAIESCRIEGKLYALPVNGHPGWSGLYYQPELFEEAGVAEPTDEWTYDDVITAALELTQRNGDQIDVYGLWVAPYFEASLTPISAFGGWPLNDEGTQAMYDDENTIAGVKWIRDAMNEHKVALSNPSFSSRVELWSSRKVAMVLSGIWEGSYLGDATSDDATMKLATGPIGPSGKRGGFAGVNIFPILSSSEHKHETWLWQKFICSKEIGIENVSRIGEPGLRSDVWEDPVLIDDPLVRPHFDLLQVVQPMPMPANGRLAEAKNAIQQIYSAIWLDELTVEDGCAQAQEATQAVLDQPKPGEA